MSAEWAGEQHPESQAVLLPLLFTRLCQAVVSRLSAAGNRHTAWQGGVEEPRPTFRRVCYPLVHLQTSPGGQAPAASLQVTSSTLIHTGTPLLPSSPVPHPYLSSGSPLGPQAR